MKLSNFTNGKAKYFLLTAVMFLNVACAVELNKGAGKSTPLTQAYTWFDGDREQRVWLNPELVAEFNPDSQGEQLLKSANPVAKIVPSKHQQAGIRLWQMGNNSDAALHSLKASHPMGKYSAVLHDGPSSGGRMRALPGNIIVYLDPQWDEAAIRDWLNTRKLEVVKKLEIGTNVLVIKTAPGLESLNIANTLYQSGEVKAAFPDWWQEVVAR